MGVLDMLHRDRDTIDKRSAFRITETGKQKVSEHFGGDPKSRILASLECSGSLDLGELAHASGLSPGQLERLLPILMRQGYIAQGTQGGMLGE